MNIAIFNLCAPDADFDRLGMQGEIIKKWLSPSLPEARISELHIANGVALPDASEYDGYILSGSEKGVYDSADWMQPLSDFLLTLRDADIPIFGICFGHQLMAHVYGGRAEQADLGMVVGSYQYQTKGHRFAAHAMHRDQVVVKPPGASVSISADYCPLAGLEYDFAACSVQFHPEYDQQYVANAIDNFAGDLVSDDQANLARHSLRKKEVDKDLWASRVADFFRASLAA